MERYGAREPVQYNTNVVEEGIQIQTESVKQVKLRVEDGQNYTEWFIQTKPCRFQPKAAGCEKKCVQPNLFIGADYSMQIKNLKRTQIRLKENRPSERCRAEAEFRYIPGETNFPDVAYESSPELTKLSGQNRSG